MGSATTRRRSLFVVGGLVALSVCWFLVFRAWWLNSDGSTYLGTGRSVLDGLGSRLPDGGSVEWWNRPVYPVLVALPSRVGGGIEASIWMSRIPLILAAPIIAAGTLRLGRSVPAAALAGLVAIAQPWTLLAGGLQPGARRPDVGDRGRRRARGVGRRDVLHAPRAGLLVRRCAGVPRARVADQADRGGRVPPRRDRGVERPRAASRWMVVSALALEGVAVFAALVVANGSPEVGPLDLPRTFVDRMRVEVFPGSPAIVVAAAISLFLVAWAIPRATQPLPLAGLTVTAAAVALGVYASGNGLQMRNAAMLPYGVALLLGSLVAEQAPGARWSRGPRILLGSVLVVSLIAGADARAYSASDVRERNWDNDATRGVADFLAAHRSDGSTGCTLDYCSFYWLAADQQLEMRLLPQYSARPTAPSLAGLDFSQRTGFRGPTRASPPCTGRPLVVTKSDEGFGAVFECPLLRYVRSAHPGYLVVSGSGTNDTFDAARLIPYLSSNPAFRLVYSTPASAWPHVAAVYRVIGEPRPVGEAPSYYSAAAYDALPGDHGKPGVTVLDGDCYAETIRSALSPPPSAAATTRGAGHAGCVHQ